MKKQILSAALVLSMLTTQMPAAAFAQGATMTEEDLLAALSQAENGETVELTGRVTLTAQLVIEKEIVLDGNGFTITKEGKGESDASGAGILVTAGATLRDLTVEGPNTNPDGWDSGEFAIQFYQAEGAKLQDVTVEQANGGIQINGGSVALSGTIDVSGNEFGGIEVCRQAQLDLTQAALVNESEVQQAPTIWSDSGKGTILPNGAQHLYQWMEYDSGKDHFYLDASNLGVEAQVNGVAYETLAQALEAAGESQEEKTVLLLKDVTVGAQKEVRDAGAALTLPEGVTLDGQGYAVTYVGEGNISSLLAVDGGEGVIRNVRFVAGSKAAYGLSLLNTEDLLLENVTVQGGVEAAVQVNGAYVTLKDTVLRPEQGAGIVYQADSRLPRLTLNHVHTDGEADLLYISKETMEQVGTLSGTQEPQALLEQIQSSLLGSDQVELVYDQESGSVTAPAPEGEGPEDGEDSNGGGSGGSGSGGSSGSGSGGSEDESEEKPEEKPEETPEEETPRFQDVTESDWFYEAVLDVYEKGIMTGVSQDSFAPQSTLSRAMLIQTLYALEGKPQMEREAPFADVAPDAWYGQAVAWAAGQGLAAGVGENRFAPDVPLTREQMALMLYRYAQLKQLDMEVEGEPLKDFQDGEEISGWAVEAMAWAVHTGLLSGKDGARLDPAGTATRAETAQVLSNFSRMAE